MLERYIRYYNIIDIIMQYIPVLLNSENRWLKTNVVFIPIVINVGNESNEQLFLYLVTLNSHDSILIGNI